MNYEYRFIEVPVDDSTTLNSLAADGWKMYRTYQSKMVTPGGLIYDTYRCILEKEVKHNKTKKP